MSELSTKPEQEARRNVLSAYIREHFGSVNRFATVLNRKQSQLNETVRGQRPFGEKLAKDLEAEIETLRVTDPDWRHLPPLEFGVDPDSSARLRQLIAYFEAIPTEQSQNELIELARIKSNKSGQDAASTQVGRDSPVRGPGGLHPNPKGTAQKRRRA